MRYCTVKNCRSLPPRKCRFWVGHALVRESVQGLVAVRDFGSVFDRVRSMPAKAARSPCLALSASPPPAIDFGTRRRTLLRTMSGRRPPRPALLASPHVGSIALDLWRIDAAPDRRIRRPDPVAVRDFRPMHASASR